MNKTLKKSQKKLPGLNRPGAVSETIKQWIAEQRLMPGDRLPQEPDLIKKFKVSKGTVREALKVLDAAEHLSVQVHPTAAHVEMHPDAVLKTESWFIVDAFPEAVIYKGLRPGVERGDVARAAGTPAIVELIQPVPAVPGEFHHLPAGLIHALGAGVVVAEIQTPSDTTYRLYDWTEEYERAARALHLDSAVAALELDPPGVTHLPAAEAHRVRLLTRNDHYSITEHIESRAEIALESEDELRMVMVLEGDVAVVHRDARVVVGPDAVAVVPAASAGQTHLVVTDTARFLEVGLVSQEGVV